MFLLLHKRNKKMEAYQLQIIESVIIVAVLIILRFIIRSSINKTLKKFHFSLQRRRITVKILNISIFIFALIAFTGIWGIEKEKLLLFISSVLTILGIAFFAQWSMLANITAGLLLYFNHPMKLGDHIRVLEKDFIIEGTIDDISFFFLHIKTEDGDQITIPNSIALQKNLSISHPNKAKPIAPGIKSPIAKA
ncbi:MAG: mechanosensitive ion channel family protein [Prolixibacteraceae bacterium]